MPILLQRIGTAVQDYWINRLAAEGASARWGFDGMSSAECWLNVVANLGTFLACTAIPLLLARFIRRRSDLPFSRTFWLFTALIFVLGLVQLVEAATYWYPVYRLGMLLKIATAVCSLAAAMSLVPVVPRALALPGLERVNARLRKALADRSRLASIVADSRDAILATDLEGRVTIWNRAAEELFGWRQDEILGHKASGLIVPRASEEGAAAPPPILDLIASPPEDDLEVDAILRDNESVPVSLVLSPIHDDTGRRSGAAWIVRDIRESLIANQKVRTFAKYLESTNRKLKELVQRDPLTGLLNRRGMDDALQHELGAAERNGEPQVALLIDCDDFKSVNDRFGHEAGDAVIRQLAQRIQASVRSSDHVARIGGDEFLVLLPDTRFHEGLQLAERVRLAVADLSFAVPGEEIRCTVSIGAESVVGATSLEDLMRRTGAALRRSKVAGKNLVSRHDAVHEGDIESLIGEDLEVWAQPIVAVSDESVYGFEMLIRGPHGPFRNPNDFFRVCREQDVLTRVDLACLRACLAAAQRLPTGVGINVNLFPSTVEHAPEGLLEDLLGTAAERLDGVLAIELNESMLVGDPAGLGRRLTELREAVPVRIAIDDVGFGRSSLEALIVLEPDVVKIDRRYVQGIGENEAIRRHLARLLRVAEALGASVVAEGVEEPADRDALLELGVEYAQGYHWARPTPSIEYEIPRPDVAAPSSPQGAARRDEPTLERGESTGAAGY